MVITPAPRGNGFPVRECGHPLFPSRHGACVGFSHSLPSIAWWRTTAGWQAQSRPSAAGGGGRRPAFTGLAIQPYWATKIGGWPPRSCAICDLCACARKRSSNDRKQGCRARSVLHFRHRNGRQFDRLKGGASANGSRNICIAVTFQAAGIVPPVSKCRTHQVHAIDTGSPNPVLVIAPRDDVCHTTRAPFGRRHFAN